MLCTGRGKGDAIQLGRSCAWPEAPIHTAFPPSFLNRWLNNATTWHGGLEARGMRELTRQFCVRKVVRTKTGVCDFAFLLRDVGQGSGLGSKKQRGTSVGKHG